MSPQRRLAEIAVLSLCLAIGCGGGGSPTQAPLDSRIGVVGCSLTMASAKGYETLGGSGLWPAESLDLYPGGDFLDWAEPNDPRWSAVDAALAEFGAGQVWLQICVSGARSDPAPTPADLEAIESVVHEIARRLPAVPIRATPLPEYVPVSLCPKKGTAGTALSEGMVDHLVATGLASRGPMVGPLDTSTTLESTRHCGLNEAGKALIGQQLLDFFGP